MRPTFFNLSLTYVRRLVAEAKEIKGWCFLFGSMASAHDQPAAELEQGLNRARGVLNRVRGSHAALPLPSSKGIAARRGSNTGYEPTKCKMSAKLTSLLVYTVGVKCRGFNKKERYAIEHVFSLSEKMANKILKQGMVDLIKHNRAHVVRIYPNGLRLNSSNFEPHRYWAAGAQLAAINWQTYGTIAPACLD